MLRALIVDDEAPARAHLRALLEDLEGVELVGEASNAMEAEKLLRAIEHDVVFLDIRLPGLDGIEAAEFFAELPKPPYVVFTTAFEEYAAKAFEVGAADYLLKPISKRRLQMALSRARERVELGRPEHQPTAVETAENAVPTRPGSLRFLTARRGHRLVLLGVEDIVFLSVEGETVWLFTEDESFVALAPSLDQLEKELASDRFFRTHRRYLVQLDHVGEVVPMFNRTFQLVMKDARRSRVPVSRRKAVELRALLGF